MLLSRAVSAIDTTLTAMSVSMDEINYLIWCYMQENGFPHTAFVFETESFTESTNICHSHIPPNSLITLLQKSLLYLRLEKSIKDARGSSDPQLQKEIQNVMSMFPSKDSNSRDDNSNDVKIGYVDKSVGKLLNGNRYGIKYCAWNPSGTKLALLEENGLATVWERSEDGSYEKRITLGDDADINLAKEKDSYKKNVSWSFDGKMIAIGDGKKTTIFAESGEQIATAEGSSALEFNPEKNLIAICTNQDPDFAVKLYEVRSDGLRLVEEYQIHQRIVKDICWRDEGMFVTASEDKCVGECTVSGTKKVFRSHTNAVNCISFSFDKSMYATGSDDGTIHVWKGGRKIKILKGHSSCITSIDWHPSLPNIIVSASIDGTARVWDVLSGDTNFSFAHHANGISVVKWHKSGEYIFTGGNDNILAIWRMHDSKMLSVYSFDSKITYLDFDPSGENITICFESPIVSIIPIDSILNEKK